MREIVFRVHPARPGQLQATAVHAANPIESIHIEAPSLEELHHEAREALIERLGPSHVAYRVRLQRPEAAAAPAARSRTLPPRRA